MFSVTIIIIVITSIFTIAAFNSARLKEDMLFWPAEINTRKQYYRFFSYGLIHADFMHALFNLFTLYSFGTWLEKYTFAQYDIFVDKA